MGWLQVAREPTAGAAHRGWVLVAMSGALAMTFIDETGVGVALSTIRHELHASRLEVHWVMNAYMLTLAAVVAVGGRLSDLLGRRRVFTIGLVVFGTGSLLCALAPDVVWLIGVRAVQGVGAALMIPTAMAIVSQAFPPEQRGRAVGAYIGAASVFYVIGPLLAGALTQHVSWRWVFGINVPIAVVVWIISVVAVDKDPPPVRRQRFDMAGMFTNAAGLGALVVAIMQAPTWGWASPPVVALLVAAVALFGVFVAVERHTRTPLFDLAILRDEAFSAGVAIVFIVYVVYLGLIVYLPLFLQHEAGLRPFGAGLALMVALGPIIFVAPVNGRIVDRVGARLPTVITGLTAVAAFAWLATAASTRSLWLLVPALLLYGVSIPAAYNSAVTVAQNVVADEHRGQASGIITSAAQAGAPIGVAMVGAVVVAVSGSADYTMGGFQAGFLACAVTSAIIVVLAFALPRTPQRTLAS
jgi:EmrB/QacA subfamily drug resistance transporter